MLSFKFLSVFKDDNITHVSGKIDPVNDAEIRNKLLLSDIESIEKDFSFKKLTVAMPSLKNYKF